jgi:hypothetical protein
MAVTNNWLLISESRDDSNRCIPCREKPNQHATYASHASPRTSGVRFLRAIPVRDNLLRVVDRVGRILLLPIKSAPDSTSQPGWVAHGTHLNFSPKIAIEPVGLSQAPVDDQLLGLSDSYHRHVISTFNTCSRVSTPRSLTNTGGGYHIENLRIATSLSQHFLSEGSTDPSNDVVRSQIIQTTFYHFNWRGKQALNPMSGSLHPTSTVTYHLRIAWANDVPPR